MLCQDSSTPRHLVLGFWFLVLRKRKGLSVEPRLASNSQPSFPSLKGWDCSYGPHTHLALCLLVSLVLPPLLDLHWGQRCLSIFCTSTVFTAPTPTSLELLPSHPLLKLLTSSCYCYIFPRICVYKDNLPNSFSAAPLQGWSLGIG